MTYEQNVNNELRNFQEHQAYPTAAPQPFDRIEEPGVATQRKKPPKRATIIIVVVCVLLSLAAVVVLVGVVITRGRSYNKGQDDTGALTPLPFGPLSSSTTTVTITGTADRTSTSEAESTSTSTITITSTASPPDPSTLRFTYSPPTSFVTATVSETVTKTVSPSLPVVATEAPTSSFTSLLSSLLIPLFTATAEKSPPSSVQAAVSSVSADRTPDPTAISLTLFAPETLVTPVATAAPTTASALCVSNEHQVESAYAVICA
ncbi:hypothetical protein LTR36_010560 [Oleoguttula mirabilis]|uniref:Uncharacterized protein n=1 Tax=Oleoguttula mirabilis TaxID=1507867 RepID=A0AAV9JQW6_9PEZI|nr:hypothetical protein LTR36_010560 [Oleoguttula mirabilis]